MANTKIGGAKTAASKIGCTFQEYLQKRESGFKWCLACRTWVSFDFFCKNSSAFDGLNDRCKNCSRIKDRQRYKPVPIHLRKPRGFAVHPPRDGDKQQARNRVNREVAKG